MIAFAVGALFVCFAAWVTATVCRRLPSVAGFVPWLVVMLATAVATIAFFDIPLGTGTDEVIYQTQAEGVRLSLVLTGGFDPDYAVVDAGKAGFPTLLGTLYFLVGTDNPFLGVVMNSTIAYLAIFLAAAAGARLHGPLEWRAKLGMVLVASPTLIMYGSTLLRECWAWLAVALAVHGLIWLVRRAWWTGSLVSLGAMLLAYWIRAPLAPILVAAIVAGLIISVVWRRVGTKSAIIIFFILGLVGQLALGLVLAAVGYSAEALFVTREYLADSATTGFVPADPFTPLGLVQSLARVGLGPLPWEWRAAPAWAWVFVNWVYWVLLLVLAWRGVRRAGLDAVSVALIAFSVVLLVGLAVGLTNYGIVVRMRSTVIVALIPLIWGILAAATVSAPDRELEEAA